MSLQQTQILAPIVREVLVSTTPHRAFDIFVHQAEKYWPASHTLVEGRTGLIIEPKVGGRWFETGENETQAQWGEVLEIEPGRRLLLAWQLSDEWVFDPAVDSELEITFVAQGDKTLLTLTHSKFESMGSKVLETYEAISGEGGWTSIFAAYSELVSS